MTTSEDLLRTLRTWHKLPAKQLLERLGISRATLMRAVRELGSQVVVHGRARRTAYAARRALRGSLHALPLLGSDTPGNYVLGEPALRQWLAHSQQNALPLEERQVGLAYPLKAEEAMTHGTAGSSAGGEFPKFTAFREVAGKPTHVIV